MRGPVQDRATIAGLLAAAIALCCAVSGRAASLDPADAFLVACAEEAPSCASVWAAVAPPAFSVAVDSTQGPFTIHVNTSWAPPFAQRFYTLVLLDYFAGAPLYRVLPGFVSQFGWVIVSIRVGTVWLL
jgi:hypothetical protein